MQDPIIFKFDMFRARLQRVFIFLMLPVIIGMPVFVVAAGYLEKQSAGVAISILVALIVGPLLWTYYRANVKICFPTGVALEIHPRHLLVATSEGMKEIPRSAIKHITGPRYTSNDVTVHSSAEIVVDDTYQVTSWFGFRRNPIVHGSLLADTSEWNAMGAMKTWHADKSAG